MKKNPYMKLLGVEAGLLAFLVPAVDVALSPEHFIFFKRTLSEALLFCVCLTVAAGAAKGGLKLRAAPGHFVLALLPLLGIFSLIGRSNTFEGACSAVLALDWLLAALAGYLLLGSGESVLGFARWASLGLLAAGGFGVFEHITGLSPFLDPRDWHGRVSSSFGAPTLYAGYLLAAAPAARIGYSLSRGKEKFFHAAAWALGAYNIFLTGTLAAWAALVIEELFFILCRERRAALKKILFLAAGAACLAWLFLFGPLSGINTEKFKENKSESVKMRVSRAVVPLNMAWDRPARGVGIGLFETYYPEYNTGAGRGSGRPNRLSDPENLFLQAAAETGVPGLLAMCALCALVVFPGRRAGEAAGWRNRASPFYRGGGAGVLAFAMFHSPLHTPGVWPVFFVMAGGAWAAAGTNEYAETVPGPEGVRGAGVSKAAAVAAAGILLAAFCAAALYREVNYYKAAAYIEAGNPRAALPFSSRAVTVTFGKDPESLAVHALALFDSGSKEEAFHFYNQAAAGNPWNLETRFFMFNRIIDDPASGPARAAILRDMKRIDPGNPRLYALSALDNEKAGRYEDAAADMKKYIELADAPGWRDYYRLFTCLVQAENRDPAEELRALASAVSLEPDEPMPYYQLGLAMEAAGDAAKAARLYELSLQRDGNFMRAREALGRLGGNPRPR